MEISLGTAKIGMHYGITSKKKSIKNKDLVKIFSFLKKNNINSLDISPLYGNLFKKIKKFNLQSFDITYKIYIEKNKFSEEKIIKKIKR